MTDIKKEIRIAWKIHGFLGFWFWFPSHKREELQRIVDRQNAEDGPGTHWIEERTV